MLVELPDTIPDRLPPAVLAYPDDRVRALVKWGNPDDLFLERLAAVRQLAGYFEAIGKHEGPKVRFRWFRRLVRLLKMSETMMTMLIGRLPSQFPGAMLNVSEWVGWAKLCGIPHIPLEVGPELTVKDVEEAYTALGVGDPARLPSTVRDVVLPWLEVVQERGWMWRFDVCAPETIKRVMGCIRPEGYLTANRVRVPFSVDNRVLHCLWDSRQPLTRLVSRPWMAGQMVGGFPVEIRVYRQPDGYAACNYYVQRALPPEYFEVLEQAVALTEEFDRRARARPMLGNLPAFPQTYSVDWLLMPNRELRLVEGGPPHGRHGGAHPCCFNPERLVAGRRLLAGEEGSEFYCPPKLQVAVDQLKGGELLDEVAAHSGINAGTLVAFAAIQGVPWAQVALHQHAVAQAKSATTGLTTGA
jgi:hypothetical protein